MVDSARPAKKLTPKVGQRWTAPTGGEFTITEVTAETISVEVVRSAKGIQEIRTRKMDRTLFGFFSMAYHLTDKQSSDKQTTTRKRKE